MRLKLFMCWSCGSSACLQEYFQERWSKLVTPKLQEDAKQSRGEEDALKQRKAAAARAAADVAAQEAACRLASSLDELHEQLAQLRVQVGAGAALASVCTTTQTCLSLLACLRVQPGVTSE
jgi:hypothetical protein